MKHIISKSILLTLCLLMGGVGSKADVVDFTLGSGKEVSSNSGMTKNSITVSAADDTSTNNWSNSGYAAIQVGSTLTVSPNNATITSIILDYKKDYEGEWEVSTGTVSIVSRDLQIKWKGTSISAVIFTNIGSRQARISSITVTYTPNSDPSPNPATHTYTFYSNGESIASGSVGECVAIPFPENPADIYGKTFVGWTASEMVGVSNSAPALVSSATMGAEDVTFYAVFARKLSEESWERVTSLSAVTPGAYVIKSGDYCLSSSTTGGSSSPSALTAPQIESNKIAAEVGENMKWYFTSGSKQSQFYVQNASNHYLYETASDLRVGTTPDEWLLSEYPADCFSMQGINNSRYCGKYASGHDWRCYETKDDYRFANNGKIELYRLTSSTSLSSYCTTVTSSTFSISQYQNTTLCLGYAYVMPEGLVGKTISAKEGSGGDYVLTLTTKYVAGDVVPAGEALVIQGAQGSYTALAGETSAAKTDYPANLLVGEYYARDGKYLTSFASASDDTYYYYKLTTSGGANFGWYYGADDGAPFLMTSYERAYLVIKKDVAAQIRGFVLDELDDGSITDVDLLPAPCGERPVVYSLQGQRLKTSQRGVYIVNGRKVIW